MNKTEHLLTCLMEECAEVQKAAAKALRFGLDDHAPGSETTNAEDIAREYADLAAVMEMLEAERIVTPLRLSRAIRDKKERVTKYMEYAMSRGALT